ncbi:MAG TPA: hypothetical protein VHR97_00455 [Candidatus Baltobacteraceae bacterium]|jgi:hypothetical protein|nr:hypothetical protein [Candidatus Baltobacteraceae bacterium]
MLAGHPSHAGDNQTALQQVIVAAIGAGGGTILIPTGTYYIEGPILINPGVVAMPPVTTPFTLNIVGTGQTRLIVTTAEDLFRIDNTVSGTNEDANAIVFQDLMIEYDTGGGANSGVAIKAGTDVGYSGARNLHLLRVTLFNCPQAVLLGNTKRVSIFDSIANSNTCRRLELLFISGETKRLRVFVVRRWVRTIWHRARRADRRLRSAATGQDDEAGKEAEGKA